jgi:hypothetical protein
MVMRPFSVWARPDYRSPLAQLAQSVKSSTIPRVGERMTLRGREWVVLEVIHDVVDEWTTVRVVVGER